MERVVKDVEDNGENEGCPANPQSYENFVCSEFVRVSSGVDHSDGLARCGHHQGHHGQTEREKNIFIKLL